MREGELVIGEAGGKEGALLLRCLPGQKVVVVVGGQRGKSRDLEARGAVGPQVALQRALEGLGVQDLAGRRGGAEVRDDESLRVEGELCLFVCFVCLVDGGGRLDT